jgi:hypothetical protein
MREYTTLSIDREVANEIRGRREAADATTTEVLQQLLKAAKES